MAKSTSSSSCLIKSAQICRCIFLTFEVGNEKLFDLAGSERGDDDFESVDRVDLEVDFLSEHLVLEQLHHVDVVDIDHLKAS